MSDQNILESEIKLLLNHYNANNFAFVIQKSLNLVKIFGYVILFYNLTNTIVIFIYIFKYIKKSYFLQFTD